MVGQMRRRKKAMGKEILIEEHHIEHHIEHQTLNGVVAKCTAGFWH